MAGGNRNKKPLTDEQQKLAEQFAPMAKWAVRKWPWASDVLGPDDALGVAQVAIVYAARKYDIRVGVLASTYFAKTVYRHLQRACSMDGVIGRKCMRGGKYSPEIKAFSLTQIAHRKEYTEERWIAVEDPVPPIEVDEIDSLRSALRFLGANQQEVIRRCFFERQTLAEIGRAMGLTRARAGQIKDEALDRLRRLLREGQDGGVCEVRE